MTGGRVLVYGGKGALGMKCVSFYKENNWWVCSIDLAENSEADVNILVGRNDEFSVQEQKVLEMVSSTLKDSKLDAIVCVAGGWAGGNAKTDLIKNSDLMWRQSVWSSLISTSVAASHLKEGGLLTLTGAKAALEPTPGMIGYGMAKAAVHQLTKSLGAEGNGLPLNSVAVALLPVTLDTPMNRKWMPNADFSSWTPLEEIARTVFTWSKNENRPVSGSLVQVVTRENKTEFIVA